MTFQDKLYSLLEEPEKSRASYLLNVFIYILILVSIVNLMLMTVSEFQEKYGDIFLLIRNIVMPIFIVEYALRLYASGSLDKYKGFKGKIKYATTPYAIIDLLAILPYILVHFASFPNSSVLRSLRLLRVFRLFRVKKYAIFVQLMKQIFSNIKEEILVLVFYTVVILVILSFLIFQIEHEAQPDVFTNVFQTMWWGVATLTTVGYGDMYPITTAGKIITSVITIMGIAFVAIPGGMFASEFIAAMNKHRDKEADKKIDECLRCGSTDVSVYDDIVLSNDRERKRQMYVCDGCGFTWIES